MYVRAGYCHHSLTLSQRKLKPFLKLTYFDIPGLAEAIRLAFHVADIPFVDERLTQEQFNVAKGLPLVHCTFTVAHCLQRRATSRTARCPCCRSTTSRLRSPTPF